MAEKSKKFSCPACGAEFDTREQLEKHGEREHQHAHAGHSGGGMPGSSGQKGQSGGSGKSKR